MIALPARPNSTRAVRERLRSWNWPEDDLDDIVVSVDEAVAPIAVGGAPFPTIPGTAVAACRC